MDGPARVSSTKLPLQWALFAPSARAAASPPEAVAVLQRTREMNLARMRRSSTVWRAVLAAMGAMIVTMSVAGELDVKRSASDPVETGVTAWDRGHYATSMRAWRPAADRGDPMAQNNIGLLYERGLGVPQSYVEAMVWYRRAAEKNLSQAQYNIGLLYHAGYGVERNPREALAWFRKAAAQNLAHAQYMLGLIHHEGQGSLANPSLALDWFHKAAIQGHAGGQMMAGLLYLSGDAGKVDAERAFLWSDVALRNGMSDAELIRDYASYKLSRKKIEAARRDAERCFTSAFKSCPQR